LGVFVVTAQPLIQSIEVLPIARTLASANAGRTGTERA
jgi:hypothetical protein